MSTFRKLLSLLTGEDNLPKWESLGLTRDDVRKIRDAAEDAARIPPRIALIGETGVGKSTTINALFNAGRPISHIEACTKDADERQYEFRHEGEKGDFIVVDMPGLGEDVDTDEEHLALYRRVLPTCDVVLWVLKADNRAITNVQRSLKSLVDDGALVPKRLVVAMNQVDLMQPGEWDEEINMPSERQEATINGRISDIEKRLRKVIDLPDDRVVPYSALRCFALDHLLKAMVDACDRTRQWVLLERADTASFLSLIDPALVAEAKRS